MSTLCEKYFGDEFQRKIKETRKEVLKEIAERGKAGCTMEELLALISKEITNLTSEEKKS